MSELIESQQEELHCAQADERRRQDHQLLQAQLLRQNWELREAHKKSLKHQKYKGRVVFRGDIVKDDSGSYAVFTEQGSSASQMTAAKVIMRLGAWSYDMEGHAKKCVERYCQLANKTTRQLYKVSIPCIDDHHFKEEEMKSAGEL